LIGVTVSTPKASRRPLLRVVIRYPLAAGRLVLRTDSDWAEDVAPIATEGTDSFEFEWPADRPFGYFKAVIVGAGPDRWAIGPNSLAIAGHRDVAYPYFEPHAHCAECVIREIEDASGRVVQRFRAFYPPGYFENTVQRYPVLYMQDGQNLFFPGEAFGGAHWRIAETLSALDAMSVLRQVIVVGLYSEDRQRSYTQPGYHEYGRRLVEQVKPVIDREYRTMPGAETTAVMGSSLGGVVSLYLAWQFPEVFGMAACLSSTFGWADDLRQRIARELRRPIRVYLDSGWPDDNFEATRAMHVLLRSRGYVDGRDLSYLAFPEARHDERHWAMRAHIPFQQFFGDAPRA
jgi:predicted alpha/beta superfamily hydrolase